ncbi:MAG: hypothetical protein Q9175_006035 [Cornicularia normoerica]
MMDTGHACSAGPLGSKVEMRFHRDVSSFLFSMYEQGAGLQDGLQLQTSPHKAVRRPPGSQTWSRSSRSYVVKELTDALSKLEEVTSELTSLKEAFKSQSAPRNLTPNQTGEGFSRPDSPEAGLLGLQATRSISVDAQVSTFFGIDILEHSAYEIGEQILGDIRLSGMAIVQLFEQYLHHILLAPWGLLTVDQFPTTLLSAWDHLGYFSIVA